MASTGRNVLSIRGPRSQMRCQATRRLRVFRPVAEYTPPLGFLSRPTGCLSRWERVAGTEPATDGALTGTARQGQSWARSLAGRRPDRFGTGLVARSLLYCAVLVLGAELQ